MLFYDEQKDHRSNFDEMCNHLGDLYDIKNTAYENAAANQFNEEGLSYVNSIFGNKVMRLKAIDKATKLGQPIDLNGESVEDTLKDIANYAIIALMELKKQNEKEVI